MKTLLLLAGLLLAGATASAQVAPVKPPLWINDAWTDLPSRSYNITSTAGNTLVAAIEAETYLSVTDSLGNAWQLAAGEPQAELWVAFNAKPGANILTVKYNDGTLHPLQMVLAEYPPLGPIESSAYSGPYNRGTLNAISPAIQATAGDILIGFGHASGFSVWTNTGVSPIGFAAGPGFTLRGAANVYLEDGAQAVTGPARATADYSNVYMPWPPLTWEIGIVAFKPAVPLLAPTALAVTGSLLFDDGTTVLNGTMAVSQLKGASWTGIGAIVSNAAGVLSGSFTVDPNFTRNNTGVVWIDFSLPGIPGIFEQGFQPGEFTQGSTGLTINVVIFKKNLLVKSLAAGLTP